MAATSPLKPSGVFTWPLTSYETEINRDVKWYSSWANHYFQQGGLGLIAGAIEIIPLVILQCPILNVITYLVSSILFQGQENALMKGALNEGNATAAYIMTERGANPDMKSQEGKTLLDLFAEKGEREKGFTEQDLAICTTLLKNKGTADFSRKGFSQMLEIALTQKLHTLALSLLQAGVDLESSWKDHIPKSQTQKIELPKWSTPSLPQVRASDSRTSLKMPLGEDLNRKVAKGFTQKFSSKGLELEQLTRIFGQVERNCPLILGEDESERGGLVEALTRHILLDRVPDHLKKKRIVGIDLERIDNLGSLNQIRSILNDYSNILENDSKFIFYIHNFDIFDRSVKNSHHTIQKEIFEWAKTGRVIFSMKPGTYDRFFAKNRSLQRAFTPIEVSKPSAQECLPLLSQIKATLERKHHTTFSAQALQAAIFMSRYLKDNYFPQTPYEILDAAATLMAQQETHGSFALQDAQKKRRALVSDLQILSLRNGNVPQQRIEKVQAEIEEQSTLIDQLKQQDQVERGQKARYRELTAKKAYLKALKAQHEPLALPLLEAIEKELEPFEAIKQTANLKFEVDRDLIARIVSERAQMPLSQIQGDEAKQLAAFAKTLKADVIGQDAAVQETADAIIRARTGFRDESKPRGVFLYGGPTGVGKTELAKALARSLFGDERNMTRLDMSEYGERYSRNRLIGSPPGYVGYEEGGQLTEALQRNPYQVVLIDEVEKAAPEVLSTFLQVFDDGRLTDGKGNTVDCSQAIFIMTTNLGSRELMSNANRFSWRQKDPQRIIQEAIINSPQFPPELYNRVDAVIPFQPLTNLDVVKKIAEKILKGVQKHAMDRNGIDLTWTDAALEQLAREGRSPQLGARPLKRLIDQVVQTTLAKALIHGEIKEGDTVELNYGWKQGYWFKKPNSA